MDWRKSNKTGRLHYDYNGGDQYIVHRVKRTASLGIAETSNTINDNDDDLRQTRRRIQHYLTERQQRKGSATTSIYQLQPEPPQYSQQQQPLPCRTTVGRRTRSNFSSSKNLLCTLTTALLLLLPSRFLRTPMAAAAFTTLIIPQPTTLWKDRQSTFQRAAVPGHTRSSSNMNHGAERGCSPATTFFLSQKKNEEPYSVISLCESLPKRRQSGLSLSLSSSAESTTDNDNDKNDGNDEDEWQAVVAAFQMYQAAYGDLKVPQRFVVPNLAPWPRSAWGLKLGKVVQAIRSTGRYLSSSPSSSSSSFTNRGGTTTSRRQVLDQLGFVWSVRRSNEADTEAEDKNIQLEQVLTAVQAYKSNARGKNAVVTDIPDTFVVPDDDSWPESVRGLPLGRQLEAVKRSSQNNVAVRQKLAALGILMDGSADEKYSDSDVEEEKDLAPSSLPPSTPTMTPSDIARALEEALEGSSPDGLSANDVRFQNVYTALATYQNLYDDLLVPQPFVVPKNSPDWPKEIWGLRLGARVNAIRSQGTFVNNSPTRRKLLDDLGFVWSPPKERRRGRKPKDERDMSSLGDSFAGEEFGEADNVGPTTAKSAFETIFDGSFNFGKDFDLPATEGEKTSPTWNLDGARLPDSTTKTAAEQDALLKDDEYMVPRTLEESLDEATQRAIEIGIIEGLTPKKRVIKGRREKDIPWFNDDFGDDFVFKDVEEALTIYQSIHGELTNVYNIDFVVPASKEVTGFLDDDSLEIFAMDASTRAAAAVATYEEQGLFDSSEDFIAAEIKRLQREGNRLPLDTLAESKAAALAAEAMAGQWPEHLAGMELGSLVTRMRDGSLEVKHLPERKAQLDAIGFDWGDPKHFIDIPFEKAMCAMYAYYLVRGDMFVHEDFVMPNEDPWPQALAGYEVGKAVKRLRQLQNFLEAYHPEKVSLLRMIDFVWFADTVALPLDPNETEMTPETLLLSAMGHPDYAKMIDIPMGLPDKIVADGPFMETDDDPKLWWRKWHNWDYVKDYWYQQGRRDNAFVLKAMGYPRMATEHEEKYGPGLFSQLDTVMQGLGNVSLKDKSPEEKEDLLVQLNFFRREMLGCTDIHPHDRDKLLSDLDTQMLILMKDSNPELVTDEKLDTLDFKYEAINGKEKNAADYNSTIDTDMNMDADEEVDEEAGNNEEDEEFDIEDELGLGGEQW